MKVLIVGNGSREHALVRQFSRSKRISGLFCAPGNAGTADSSQNFPEVKADDLQGIVALSKQLEVDLVFVGPEAPLAIGLVDSLRSAGIKAIGPDKQAARLESSKAFSKDLLLNHSIPTAQAKVFTKLPEFERFIDSVQGPWVVKKSGLAAGKGVLESDSKEELKQFGRTFINSDSIVVEEYLRGYEVSIFAIADGISYQLLPSAADYKKAGEGNTGPNTGGMGAICPVPWLDKSTLQKIESDIVEPTFKALRSEGLMYKGILYFGLMITEKGPKVLEFNVRFGDPEAQVVLPLIKSDFCSLWEAVALGTLSDFELQIDQRSAIGVVVAAPGYPGEYKKDLPVNITFNNKEEDRLLFHASTYTHNQVIKTSGGRCFTAVGLGQDCLLARAKAYSLLSELSFDGAWSRPDIGANVYSQKY